MSNLTLHHPVPTTQTNNTLFQPFVRVVQGIVVAVASTQAEAITSIRTTIPAFDPTNRINGPIALKSCVNTGKSMETVWFRTPTQRALR
jgi:hypothetical protein